MKTIYLIGPTTGAARTSQEHMARNVELICGYPRCTQQEYLQRMREIRALDLPPDICPTCGTQMDWEDCDVCRGRRYIDACDLSPLWYDIHDVKMCCNQCYGLGGWYTCPNYHNHPTEFERTASNVTNEPK